MAVSEMKKFSVICPLDGADKLIKRLMWLSCVDIKQRPRENSEYAVYERLTDIDAAIAEKKRLLVKIKEIMDVLALYDTKEWEKSITLKTKKKPFSAPREVDFDEFVESGRYDVAISQLERIDHLTDILKKFKEEYNSLKDEYAALSVWKSYDAPLNLRKTAFSEIRFGTLGKKADFGAIANGLCGHCAAAMYKIGEDKHAVYVSVVIHSSDVDAALSYLNSHGFSEAYLPEADGSISDAIRALEKKIEKNLENTRKIQENIAAYVGFESRLCVAYDVISTDIVELEAKKQLVKTGSVCIIDGWTPSASCERVQKTLDKLDCAYELSDPEEGDDVPVLLKNNAFASAFEPIVSLYSLPKYKTFDPTFIMSIFYVIIFGLMFADVGYGIILALGCFLAIKLLYPRGTMKKFFQMFGICGLSCALWGVILGGYFGDFPTTVLGINQNVALWFDPINDPITFLVLSIVVGAVHMITGMILKMVILIKQGKVFSAIFDIGSWIVVFVGIAIAIFNTKIGLITALFGVAMLVLTQGRAQKNIIMKLVKGIGSLYSITSYASDLLSYTRILALGLASAVIAKVVNVIASLGGHSIGGYILLVAVLLIGHLLNMAINLLGTFVHASRLQYIEFFGKFYDEGGTPFNVVAPKSKYVIFKTKKDL